MAITGFILARVAEEEAAAHKVLDGPSASGRGDSGSEGEHYDMWNPWRVQSACIVRRLLVRAHRNAGPTVHRVPGEPPQLLASTCRTCHDADGQPTVWPCYTLRVLASEWSHHPDYRSEWRPTKPTDPAGASIPDARGHAT